MRIVSLNAWGGTLWPELAAWLPAADADVLCLQETTRTDAGRGWTTFADAARTLPQRADLFDDVRALLPGRTALFDASDAGPVTLADGTRVREQFGLGMFVAAPHPVLAHETRFVHGAYVEHAEWPVDGRPRVAQGVRLEIEGRTLAVVHVHGLRVGSGKHDSPQRLAQARRLAEFVTELRRPGDAVVLCGDLNLLPSSKTFAILAEAGLVDLVRAADTRTSHYAKPVRHAGYLLVSAPDAVVRFEVLAHPEVSDHRALAIEL